MSIQRSSSCPNLHTSVAAYAHSSAVTGKTSPLTVESIKQTGVVNVFQPDSSKQHFSTGLITHRTYELLRTKSNVAVLDLLPIDQHTLESENKNERNLAQFYKVKYENIPVAGVTDITFENAEKVRSFFSNRDNETVIIHCKSANRNGAMMALAAFACDGKDEEQAISIGKSWGLTKLESKVKAVIVHKRSMKQ